MTNKILTPYSKGSLNLKNHLVMAPMTRSRAIGNIPNDLIATYYSQRTGAGLIITEGTSPTPEGLGYSRIPGIYSEEQIEGWKKTTEAVHKDGTKIFLQIMHTGRIGHTDNLPLGYHLVGPSNIKANGQIHTDQNGKQDFSQPEALSTEGIQKLVADHVIASQNAVKAGFDGIELHGANGYIIEQFLNPHVNNRTDAYGGSAHARAKIVIDMARNIAEAIGKEKMGIRFSPYSTNGDLQVYDHEEVMETYTHLASELNKIGIAYIHISMGATTHPDTISAIRKAFEGTIILCNGLTPESAEAALDNGIADLVAFARSFLANPDLDKRIAMKAPLNQPDFTTLFTAGPEGLIDYPVMS